MKFIKLLILLLFAFNFLSFAQTNESFDREFTTSFFKNFRIPKVIADSCLNQNVLLKISFDNEFKTPKFDFSDNAISEMKKELERIEGILNTKSLFNYLINTGNEKINIIYPLFITVQNEKCPSGKSEFQNNQV